MALSKNKNGSMYGIVDIHIVLGEKSAKPILNLNALTF